MTARPSSQRPGCIQGIAGPGPSSRSAGNVYDAIEQRVQKIGTAITVSGLATFFGFSALILSTFPVISNFGISTIIAVLFSLIGAIVVMPAGLALMDRADQYVQRHRAGAAQPTA